MKKLNTITLPALSGKDTISQAKNVFTAWIDSDFENWGTDKKGNKTDVISLAVCEMTEDATFAQLFTKPDEMCLSQAQIIAFCKNHKDELRQDGYATFFLFKVDIEFFVASVYVRSGELYVFVYPFSNAHVWCSGYRHRVVFPQLALEPSETSERCDTVPLSPSDPKAGVELEEAIEVCKKNGLTVSKIY